MMQQTKVMSTNISNLAVSKTVADQFGKVKYPFAFTKNFKAITFHEPSVIRVHVCFITPITDGSNKFHGGYSFFLGGGINLEWDQPKAMDVLEEQVVNFAKHT